MKKLVITAVIVLIVCLAALHAQPPDVSVSDPNSIADPNAIKLPEGAKMPVQLKCPAHGIIGKAFIAIETDTGTNIHCARCAKTFISKVFELNLPKLEIMK